MNPGRAEVASDARPLRPELLEVLLEVGVVLLVVVTLRPSERFEPRRQRSKSMLAALPLISVRQVMDAPSRTVTVTRTPRLWQALRTFSNVGSSTCSWKSAGIATAFRRKSLRKRKIDKSLSILDLRTSKSSTSYG